MEGIVMESVWVAVGFVVFVALIWRRVGAAVGSMLDDRSQKIKQDLDVKIKRHYAASPANSVHATVPNRFYL